MLGYSRIRSLPAPPWSPPRVRAFHCDITATGMGPACPFGAAAYSRGELSTTSSELPLVFETETPLFSASECQLLIDEALAHLAAGRSGSGFTLADTNHNLAVADLAKSLAWLNAEGLPRVAALCGECFSEAAIGDPRDLLIYRALVVGYDAAAGLTHQEVHRDGSLVTCVVSLSDRADYSGGGTYLEALDAALAPPRGHAVVQASALRHAGHFIDAGERWVLVLFLISEHMTDGEHVRHLKMRAQRAAEEGDDASELRYLELARAVCDDHDHELLYDAAVALHNGGEVRRALGLYERAARMNGRDVKVQRNLEAARRQVMHEGAN